MKSPLLSKTLPFFCLTLVCYFTLSVSVTSPAVYAAKIVSSGTSSSVAPNKNETEIYLPLITYNFSATIPLPPVLNPITNPGGVGDFDVSWRATAGAIGYMLQEDDNSAFTSPTTVYSGTGTTVSIKGREQGAYYYRVNAANTLGTSDWSNTESVDVTVSPPACPQVGSWTGTVSPGGYDLSFTVTESNGCQMETLQIRYLSNCSFGGFIVKTVTFNTPIAITDNQFDTNILDPEVVGDFTSPTSAEGNWSSFSFVPNCGTASGFGTWTAGFNP